MLKEESKPVRREVWYALLPGLAAEDGDPFLALGGQLLSMARDDAIGIIDWLYNQFDS